MKNLKTFSILATFLFFAAYTEAQVTVTFSTPTDGQSFSAPHDLYVLVETTGRVKKVTLYLDGELLRDEKVKPYEWGAEGQNDPELEGLTEGTYTLRAVAQERGGGKVEEMITINVGNGGGGTNTPPTVNISSPSDGATLTEGDDLSVTATANDSDGSIDYVELTFNGTFLGKDNSSPYQWNASDHSVLQNLSKGTYTIEAKAKDNEGAISSTSISITVEEDPNNGGGTGESVWSLNGTAAFYNDGRVGIGTNTPDEMLTVAGKIHSREVVVTVEAGADFVFEKDYELLPLDELAAFLEANQHLPTIAPAKEMEKEGLQLSQFSIQLLQKVEELTLYTIQIHERNQLLQESVELLKAQNEELKKEVELLKKQ